MNLDSYVKHELCTISIQGRKCDNVADYYNKKMKMWQCTSHKNWCKYCGNWVIIGSSCITCYFTNKDVKEEDLEAWNPAHYYK
jgi:hypothetical protein